MEGSAHICRGSWALSDAAHSQPGQTSDFEFRLVKPNEGTNGYPISGRYQGWFFLRTLKGQLKVEDKEINIRFIAVVGEEGCHRVEGEGSNKFGKFKVYGTLSDNGFLQMYREYTAKEPALPVKKKAASAGAPTPKANAARDGGGRVRKTSSLGAHFVTGERPPVTKVPGPSKAEVAQAESKARTQRLSQHMLRCGELLKDLMKQPQAIWFGQPVDHVALKIPDYPTIIKEPMDFGTILSNLDRHHYSAPEGFAEHVRLVFKNAIAYNTLRDNPVHVAARELSNRFEDRFRSLMSQLTAAGYGQTASGEPSIARSMSITGGAKKVKSKPSLKRNSSYGPGQMHVLPLAMDGGLLELQKKMMEMQNEISNLRAQVKQNEVKSELELHAKDSHNPLSYEEKKALMAAINKLPEAKMLEVIGMIQSVTNVRDDGENVEVSIDDLDTHTLRRLQSFVVDVSAKRSYQSADTGFANKKVKKESKPRTFQPKAAQSPVALTPASAAPIASSEFTLFGDDSYDALARNDADVVDEDDDDGFDFDLVPNGDGMEE